MRALGWREANSLGVILTESTAGGFWSVLLRAREQKLRKKKDSTEISYSTGKRGATSQRKPGQNP